VTSPEYNLPGKSLFVCVFRLWDSLGLELVPELCSLLIGDVTYHEEAVRTASADALSSAVSQYKGQSGPVLGKLTELYHKKLYVRNNPSPHITIMHL